ncbi:MAG TPA: zf-HC2 domain-containing protein [Trebonia sp.]|nr:zf-HC2 domain-containing protein [Trebonia sp.]
MSELNDGDEDMSCDEFAEVAAEFALGVLTGRERAAALAHLNGCESCREQVRELTMVGDELLALLPPAEPPAGFESRVLDRLGLAAPAHQPSDANDQRSSGAPGQPSSDVRVLTGTGTATATSAVEHAKRRPDRPSQPGNRPGNGPGNGNGTASRPRNRLSRRLLAAAAVAVALIGGGVGWGLRDATVPSSASAQASAALSTAAFVTSDHQTVGQVFVYNRSPWWAYMTVNMGRLGNATVTCQLEEADGHFKDVGQFQLAEGYGSWGSTPYTAGPGNIIGARLLSANGTVLATASFQ